MGTPTLRSAPERQAAPPPQKNPSQLWKPTRLKPTHPGRPRHTETAPGELARGLTHRAAGAEAASERSVPCGAAHLRRGAAGGLRDIPHRKPRARSLAASWASWAPSSRPALLCSPETSFCAHRGSGLYGDPVWGPVAQGTPLDLLLWAPGGPAFRIPRD